MYLDEHGDAEGTKNGVEAVGRRCLTIAGNVDEESFCQGAVQQTVITLGRLDIVVTNAAEQHPQESLEQITAQQLDRTFRTNIFSYFLRDQGRTAALAARQCHYSYHLGDGLSVY